MTEPPVHHRGGRAGPGSELERIAGRLRLLCEASAVAGRAETADQAVREVLQRTCRSQGFALGHVFLQASQTDPSFVDAGIWWPDEREAYAPVVARLAGRPLDRDTPAAVSVLSSARPRWSPPYTRPSATETERVAAACGLVGALLVPIRLAERVVGVLELFVARPVAETGELEDVLLQVAAQIGRALERAELTRLVAEAIDGERQRIGQDLHDGVGQELAAAGLLARGLERRLGSPENQESLRLLAAQVAVAQSQVRTLARGLVLRPISPESLGAELQELVARADAASDARCTFERLGPALAPDAASATHLFRIAQEALRNALEHAGATRIRVWLLGRERLSLEVRDDGRGLPADARDAGFEAAGLRSMRYRAGLIGASLRVDSTPAGTVVTCALSEGD